MRMTAARRAILEMLGSASEPLSAMDVYNLLNFSADQATVYRSLHYLDEEGLCDSFILHCADHGTERYYTASPKTENNTHRHWFHCEKCHRFTDLGVCKLGTLVSDYEMKYGLTVRNHTLYLTGICSQCSI